MKNKKTTYGLLVAVALVWGVAIYQLVTGFSGTEVRQQKKISLPAVADSAFVEDDFALINNYRDPFFGKVFTERKPVVRSSVKKPEAPPPAPKVPELPPDLSFISYRGMIRNHKTNKEVALVSIHGREYMVADGDSVQHVIFAKNYKDSLSIIYKGKNCSITRK